MEELMIASRFLHLTAVSAVLGLPLFGCTVARGVLTGREQAGFERRVRVLTRIAAVLALLSALGWFAGAAADIAGSFTELTQPEMLAAVALETHFGQLWCWRLGLNLALLAAVAVSRADAASRLRPAVVLLAAALAVSLVATGHAAIGPDGLGRVHVVADAAHLVCAAAWLGGLLGLLLLVHTGQAGSLAAALPRFSRMATIAVAMLLATGAINSALLLNGPSALIDTSYGRVLLVKIALVAAMVAFAAFNRHRVSPAIQAGQVTRAATLSRNAVAELGLGLAVLACVAVLGTLNPGF